MDAAETVTVTATAEVPESETTTPTTTATNPKDKNAGLIQVIRSESSDFSGNLREFVVGAMP